MKTSNCNQPITYFCYKEWSNKYISNPTAVFVLQHMSIYQLTRHNIKAFAKYAVSLYCLGFLFNGNQRPFVKWLLGIGILNVAVAKSGVIFTIKRSYSLLVWSECRLSILCGIPTYPTCTAGGSEKALCCQFNCIHVRHTIVSIANDKI